MINKIMEDHSVVPMPVEAPNMAEMYSVDDQYAVENHTITAEPQMVPDPTQLVAEDHSQTEPIQNMEENSMVMGEEEVNQLKRSASSSPSPDEPAAKKRSDEFDKLWKNVNETPSDFQNWTLLLQHVDQLGDLESGREAYDGFFERYPYCYGYWKKYADLERRKGDLGTAMQVFNRGLDAIQLSVDLWIHYLEFVMSSYPEDELHVRSQFERAVDTAGLEFKSDKLWETYINWETAGKRWKNVTQLYERVLATPTSKYMNHWTKFQEHVKKHLPSEVVSVDEFLSLRREVLAELNPTGETPDEAPPGVEASPGEDKVGTNVDEETKAIQKRIIDSRQEIHEKSMGEVKIRWTYEDAIKRPYFHVKPLEKSQLVAWRNYLDFEVKQGNAKQTRVLFERCLIACALYEEFWMRYVRYLEESSAQEEDIRDVYKRACCIHLQAKYRPHLSWAAFEEERGDCEKSLEILGDVTSRVESCLEPWIQLAGVERRRGNIDEAQEVYTRCLEQCKAREDKNIFAQVSLKFARFLSIFVNDSQKALEVLQEAKSFDDSNTGVLLGIVDSAMACRPPKLSDAAAALKSGTEATHQPQTRHMFAHRYFHFMNENGQEPSSVSEGLRTLRDVQAELRQLDKSNEEDFASSNKTDTSMPVSVGYQKRASQEKTNSSSPMNGASGAMTQTGYQQSYQQQPQQQQQQQQQQQGYNQAYQGYNQAYGQHQYQGWGYPSQQGGYGYGPQTWGNYGNYYGQR
ncbi:unnamed protein product [Meganyctiphanes norvegica]|uniref:Pre-mRNA-processing factor 39 n=1 Tax=Meganyctiphanes norvegica TaxID=48144 RepID=A0AAV2QTB0_MEGNR